MAPNPFDYFAIQNTIARYCIALDNKNFDLLADIFVPDVQAKFPVFGPEINDAAILAQNIEKKLQPVTTQHALTTQTIAMSEDGTAAEAMTYFTGVHFGLGLRQGEQLTIWGKYIDSLTLVEGKGALPGSSGQWKIRKREFVVMGQSGDPSIVE